MTNNTRIILFTHESYQDIFNISIDLHKQYTNDFRIIVFSNKLMDDIHPHILYHDSFGYAKRLNYCLNQITSDIDYIILCHDWALMYNPANTSKLVNVINIMKSKNIDQTRLLKASVGDNIYRMDSHLYQFGNDGLLFSQQPTIWNINTLKKITGDNIHLNYREIELGLQHYMTQFINCFYYEGESVFPKAGHHMSNIFPHIHSLRYGKWIIDENQPFIIDIFKKYNINVGLRGICH